MRRFVFMLALSMLVATGVVAREPKVVISRLSVERTGEKVTVSFRVNTARKLGKETRVFVIEPVLQDDQNKWSLPPVIIRKKDTRAARGEEGKTRALRVVAGDEADYSAIIPFRQWMDGAKLVLEKVNAGWNDEMEVKYVTVIESLSLAETSTGKGVGEGLAVPAVPKAVHQAVPPVVPPAVSPVVPQAVPPVPPVSQIESVGDRLSRSFPHVLPIGGERERTPAGGATIRFRQGSSRIEPERGDNWEMLSDLLSTIRTIEYSGDCRVKYIIVEGFASPEGSYAWNNLLAWQRASTVKEYISRHSGLPLDAILIHNGGEDWTGLRSLVEQSRMPGRDAVLHVIDRVPIWDPVLQVGRESVLKKLNGGVPYRYMFKYFFPRLRHATLVWIYYANER